MNRRSGYALALAIILMGVISVTLLALSRHLATDARRGPRQFEEAQLRQLLLAGRDIATAKRTNQQPVLPAQLAGYSLQITVENAMVRIVASGPTMKRELVIGG